MRKEKSLAGAPGLNAARMDHIMPNTLAVAMLLFFLAILSATATLWLQTLPLVALLAAVTTVTVYAIHHVLTMAYCLGKYHGLAIGYASSPELQELVPDMMNPPPPRKETGFQAEEKKGEETAQPKTGRIGGD